MDVVGICKRCIPTKHQKICYGKIMQNCFPIENISLHVLKKCLLPPWSRLFLNLPLLTQNGFYLLSPNLITRPGWQPICVSPGRIEWESSVRFFNALQSALALNWKVRAAPCSVIDNGNLIYKLSNKYSSNMFLLLKKQYFQLKGAFTSSFPTLLCIMF